MKHILLSAALALAACAGAPEAPGGPPDMTFDPGLPAPPQAKFYADCIAEAAAAGTYDRTTDTDALRFTCTGAAAKAFYDGFAAWSAGIGSEVVTNGRRYRFSQKLVENPDGVDHCWRDEAGAYGCAVILAVGKFLSS
jgi:hypothetical protein